MNPIHETGFASVILLFFLTAPAALAALVSFVLVWKRPKGAFVAANTTFILAAIVCVLAGLITLKLHTRVDEAIDSGGYGPIEEIRRRYGSDWHESARLTAWVGLVFSALPCGIAGIVHGLIRRKMPELEKPTGPLIGLGIAMAFCLVLALF